MSRWDDLHHMVPTLSGEQAHTIDRDCWCQPEVVPRHGAGAKVVHHKVRPPVVRTPRKRSRWLRPWGKR